MIMTPRKKENDRDCGYVAPRNEKEIMGFVFHILVNGGIFLRELLLFRHLSAFKT